MLSALSIDVEDYFQVESFAAVISRSEWDRYTTRVGENTRRLLKLFNRYRVHATFFVLGWVAQREPELIREIVDAGHELASHGFWHRLVYTQSPEEFRQDVAASLDAIRSACPQVDVIGYRAPCFSITRQSQWALEVLAELGFKYDSSVFPITGHDRCGLAEAPRFAHRINPRLWEIPVSTVRLLGRNWPVAGGGYFRLLPFYLTRRAIDRIHAEHQSAVVYLHPWELDPDQPRINGASRLSRFRHYLNLDKTEGRVEMLLERFSFAPLRDVYSSHLHNIDVSANLDQPSY